MLSPSLQPSQPVEGCLSQGKDREAGDEALSLAVYPRESAGPGQATGRRRGPQPVHAATRPLTAQRVEGGSPRPGAQATLRLP